MDHIRYTTQCLCSSCLHIANLCSAVHQCSAIVISFKTSSTPVALLTSITFIGTTGRTHRSKAMKQQSTYEREQALLPFPCLGFL